MVDNDIESGHPSCGRRQYGIAEPLGKDPPTAKHGGHGDLRAADRRRSDNIGYEPAGRHSRNTGNPDHASEPKNTPGVDLGMARPLPQWRDPNARPHSHGLRARAISVSGRHPKPVTNPDIEFISDGT
jgi:hypothetical protein